MQLLSLLEKFGLTVKEIKSRFANKLIKINGTLCTAIDTNIPIVNEEEIGITALDDFLFDAYMATEDKEVSDLIMRSRLDVELVPTMFNPPYDNKLSEFLSGFTCLTIGRKEHFVMIK